jgi:magnesium chelatase accessory protein
MNDKPIWAEDGRDWPNREASQFVRADGLEWHVQRMGTGPKLLLIHGTGAATHSWRGLLPLLARHWDVIAPDLPGHGFTESPYPDRQSLPGMAKALAALLQSLDVAPVLAVGHSAGAAILTRMALDGAIDPRGLVSLNGAMLPLAGMPGLIFAPIARAMAGISVVPRLFAWHAADARMVANLLRNTGSTIDAQGVEFYRRLVRRPGHVAGALAMMAHWDLQPLARDLARLTTPLALVVGGNDRTIPPRDAARIQSVLPAAEIVTLAGLGHLAHEEDPMQVDHVIEGLAARWGIV